MRLVPLHPSANCWGLLANDLCKQAVLTRSLRLSTPGWQPRDFLPLSLVCSVTEQLLDTYIPSPLIIYLIWVALRCLLEISPNSYNYRQIIFLEKSRLLIFLPLTSPFKSKILYTAVAVLLIT